MDIFTDSDSDIEFMYNVRSPRPRVFKKRANYLEEIDEIEFKKRFRVGKQTFRKICDEIKDSVSPNTNR
jgi:hypothetical protein